MITLMNGIVTGIPASSILKYRYPMNADPASDIPTVDISYH
jgi:hypothetical protein